MVKHVILWKLKDELSVEEKQRIKSNGKRELEALVGIIPGLLTMRIETDELSTSSADMMLYSEFENENALIEYRKNPDHARVANNYIRPFVIKRLCFDFTV